MLLLLIMALMSMAPVGETDTSISGMLPKRAGVLLHRRLAGAAAVVHGVGGEGGGAAGEVQGDALEVLVGEEGVLQGLNALVHHLHLGARAEGGVRR